MVRITECHSKVFTYKDKLRSYLTVLNADVMNIVQKRVPLQPKSGTRFTPVFLSPRNMLIRTGRVHSGDD